MKLAKNVSIVAITHNRSKFIARMAATLNRLDFGGCLIISESSSDEVFEKTKKILIDLDLKINITHLHTPKLAWMTISQSMNVSLKEGIKHIRTDYSMLTCDDDIPIPETLERCEKFLDENNLYNGVNGELPWYNTQSDSSEKNMFKFLGLKRHISCNHTFGLEKSSASERLDEYLNKFYHTMFSVVRVPTYKNIFPANSNENNFPHFCADYNWMFGIALTGKIKLLNEPQVIRQMHGGNLGVKGPTHPFPTYLESLITNSWGVDANMFVNNLADLIKKIDNVSQKNAFNIALEGFRQLTVLRLQKPEKKNMLNRMVDRLKRFEKVFNVLLYRVPASKKYKLYRNTTSAMVEYKNGF